MSRPDILFGIEEPLEELVHHRSILLKGWCFRRDGGEIEGIRAQIGKKVFKGRRKQRRVEIAHRYPEHPEADRSGFSIELEQVDPAPAKGQRRAQRRVEQLAAVLFLLKAGDDFNR